MVVNRCDLVTKCDLKSSRCDLARIDFPHQNFPILSLYAHFSRILTLKPTKNFFKQIVSVFLTVKLTKNYFFLAWSLNFTILNIEHCCGKNPEWPESLCVGSRNYESHVMSLILSLYFTTSLVGVVSYYSFDILGVPGDNVDLILVYNKYKQY